MVEESADPGVGPFAELLGARRAHMGDGTCRFELTAESRHLNPHGVVHGGVVYSLVDYAMGGALTSRLTPGERCATLEIKINYLAAAGAGPLFAEAKVADRTTRIGVLEARVTDGQGRLIALATGSFYIQGPRTQPGTPGNSPFAPEN
jgi:acyl-CoA thioesterase